ncbi:hypothetical protein Tco_0856055 [Tanacetum coccineum]
MANLKFADTHNMVAFLSKPEESDGFEQILDFLNAHPIKYALTVNPIIYISCIEQFWSTVKAKTINGEVQLHVLVDGKNIIITESTIRRDIQLEDAEGVYCLPNYTIFEQLTLMGSKTTTWNEFSSTMASAIIFLATNQKFNFSKFIFEGMIRNLDNVSRKFLMYPRKPKRNDTQVPQPSDPSENVAEEAVHKELGDSGGPRYQETMGGTIAQTRFENVSKHSNDSLLARESSGDEEDLGEDASKQGRINAIDADEDITLDKGKGIMIEELVKPMMKKDQIIFDEEVALKLQAEFDEEERLAREKAEKEKEANIALIEE